ncbi:MAG: glycogen/starch synthase [Anaerostipes sp.]|jgi:starch synthase|nr:glycogen/starch synthase [Anaerostipes sp.]MDD3744962.1 glycogen/starch synthase [Anaerostipes sp.]
MSKSKTKVKVDEKCENKLSVLMVAAECAPFVKLGGLADVVGTLPIELNKLGADARVMLPFHRQIKEKYFDRVTHVCDFSVQFNQRAVYVGVEKLVYNDVIHYFIDNEEYFGDAVYRGGIAEGEQYAFFDRAVVEAAGRIGFIPDILHCNDWQTGLIPILIRTQYGHWDIGRSKCIFTIHNMMYQGKFGFEMFQKWLGINPVYNTPEYMHNYDCASFMKAGVVFADRLSTVSPSYAKEILSPEYAYQMEGILNARQWDTWGIVNGIDTKAYNPEDDLYLKHHFSVDDMSGKRKNKIKLIKDLGLTINPGVPIIAMVTRLTSQKGLDLVKYILDEMMCTEDIGFIILGTGDKVYEDFFRFMENKYKGRLCAYIDYNERVAHEIYAGSDLFLMPSKFEPCGISQMIALRYGTLPVVRETGGLCDTIESYNEYEETGNGFSFQNYNAHEMFGVIKYALKILRSPKRKKGLIRRAMESDNSFETSAKKYLEMYQSIV